MANLVSSIIVSEICGIGDKILSSLFEKALYFLTSAVNKRSYDISPHRRYSAKTFQPCTSCEVEYGSFKAVRKAVCCAYLVCADTVKKVISKLSCALLSGHRMFLAIAHNVGMKHPQLDPKLLAELFTKMLISVAFLPTEVVIHMAGAHIISQLI